MKPFDKIICVGKNYLDHAKELGDAIPDNPVIFLKPPSVLKEASQWGDTVSLCLPAIDNDTQYECEVVLKLTKRGSNLSADEAKEALGYVSLGLDMTRRTLQSKLKQNGHPWTIAKVFKDSAVVGPWISVEKFPDFMDTEFNLSIENTIRQRALPNQMVMDPISLISYVSTFFPLCEDDLIFTGTPAGVYNVNPGTTATLNWGAYWYSVFWK
jgi:2-keto-4-pentenoate hydratase/2-oxohepta-3-ene-1,7-dioic acid hydratase in catechol pathway